MRMVLGASISRNLDHALADVVGESQLRPDEIDRIRRELLPLDVAIWHALFTNHLGVRTAEDAQELSRKFGIALRFAMHDKGWTEEAAEATAERFLSYLEALESQSEPQLEREGPILSYCHEFTKRVLPSPNPRNEADRDRHLQVFDLAKQNYVAQQQAFDGFLGEYRIVND